MIEQMSERTNELANDQNNERINERTNERATERTSAGTNELTNEQTNERKIKKADKLEICLSRRTNPRFFLHTSISPSFLVVVYIDRQKIICQICFFQLIIMIIIS